MNSLFFLLFAGLLGSLLPVKPKHQSAQTIRISGICFDVTTAVYLPAKAFALVGGQKVYLDLNNKSGLLEILLPTTATQLLFEVPGYQSIQLPVKVLGTPSSNARFHFSAYMAKVDSAAVKQMTQLSLSIDPQQTQAEFIDVGPIGLNRNRKVLRSPHGNRLPDGMQIKLKIWRWLPSFWIEGAKAGPYRVVLRNADGQPLINEAFTIDEGITFKEMVPTKVVDNVSEVVPSKAPPKELTNRVVYFEQSRYELTEAATRSLDSLAQTLSVQPMTTVQITGYTDNVGERSLNMTLAEYRARMVANYLRRKGIPDTQLKVLWKGPDEASASGDIEEKKVLKRKVEIQFLRP